MKKLQSKFQVGLSVFGMIILVAFGVDAVFASSAAGVILIAGFELIFWRMGIWPAVIITGDCLVVRNTFRTHRIPWGDIKEINGGGQMLRIEPRNGWTVSADAFAEGPFTARMHRALLGRESALGRTVRELEDLRKSKVEG